MSRQAYKLPNVFVGCPYSKPFQFQQFKATLDRVPFRFHFADTRLQTRHLLDILRRYIQQSDFCIFDASTWNANVALELGLADGLNSEYYIFLDRNLSKGVPSDIQGIQRIEYTSYNDFDETGGLWPLIAKYLVKDYMYPKRIWDALEGHERRYKFFYVAMRILAHFRENKRLTGTRLSQLSRGTYVRAAEQQQLLSLLTRCKVLININSRYGAKLRPNLYRDPVR